MKSALPFAGKLRVRANGLIISEKGILLVKLNAPTQETPFWMPPGGGVENGENLVSAVKREVLEETGLSVKIGELWYVTEYIKSPWHAVEFYYRCYIESGEIQLGYDPETTTPFLQDIKWVSLDELEHLDYKPVFLLKQLKEDFPDKRMTPIFLSSFDE